MNKKQEKFECALGHHGKYTWITKGKIKTYCCTVCNKPHPDYPILKTITYKKWGYELQDRSYDMAEHGGKGIYKIQSAYTLSGDYIGNAKTANFLCRKLKVKPEKRSPEHNGCSIGFCEENQKWYGWSHRAYHGFSIGDTVKKGDCAYKASNKEDFIAECIAFWDDEDHVETTGVEVKDEELGLGVQVNWEYNNKIPNKKLRGTISGVFTEYPKEFGRGKWTAKILEDCKQMAMDFADDVS